MTEQNPNEVDQAIRQRIIARSKEINQRLLVRLEAVAIDLDHDRHLAALGGIEGLDREIREMRSFLLLLR